MRATTDAVMALRAHEAAAVLAIESNLELETEDVDAIVTSLEIRHANQLLRAKKEAEQSRFEMEEEDTRLRSELRREVTMLQLERDDLERQLENASMANEKMAEAARGMAARREEMEQHVVSKDQLMNETPTHSFIFRSQRELVAERESGETGAALMTKEAKVNIGKANRDIVILFVLG